MNTLYETIGLEKEKKNKKKKKRARRREVATTFESSHTLQKTRRCRLISSTNFLHLSKYLLANLPCLLFGFWRSLTRCVSSSLFLFNASLWPKTRSFTFSTSRYTCFTSFMHLKVVVIGRVHLGQTFILIHWLSAFSEFIFKNVSRLVLSTLCLQSPK